MYNAFDRKNKKLDIQMVACHFAFTTSHQEPATDID